MYGREPFKARANDHFSCPTLTIVVHKMQEENVRQDRRCEAIPSSEMQPTIATKVSLGPVTTSAMTVIGNGAIT